MATTNHSHSHAPGPLNHETTDVTLTGITRIGVVSLIVLAVILGAVYGMYRAFMWNAADTRELPALSAYTPDTDRTPQVAPTLLLQPDEPGALRQLRAEETKILEHYGWVDKGAGVVRIPIDKAMELLVEKPELGGMTAAPAAAAPAPAATSTEAAPAPAAAAPQHAAPQGH
jgi:hypothetical protein